MQNTPAPLELRLRRASRMLEIVFADGTRHALSFEFLRVHSPSAEVQGHGPGQETLVTGKQDVGIRAIEPVGAYAVRLVFDDGHDRGCTAGSICANSPMSAPHAGNGISRACARPRRKRAPSAQKKGRASCPALHTPSLFIVDRVDFYRPPFRPGHLRPRRNGVVVRPSATHFQHPLQ